MHPQLEILLEIQDLRAQALALDSGAALRQMEERVFALTADEAREALGAKLEELEDRLEVDVRTRYDMIAGSLDRVVVPVIGGVCYGCFVATPTAWSSAVGRNDAVSSCTHCGRFMYYLD